MKKTFLILFLSLFIIGLKAQDIPTFDDNTDMDVVRGILNNTIVRTNNQTDSLTLYRLLIDQNYGFILAHNDSLAEHLLRIMALEDSVRDGVGSGSGTTYYPGYAILFSNDSVIADTSQLATLYDLTLKANKANPEFTGLIYINSDTAATLNDVRTLIPLLETKPQAGYGIGILNGNVIYQKTSFGWNEPYIRSVTDGGDSTSRIWMGKNVNEFYAQQGNNNAQLSFMPTDIRLKLNNGMNTSQFVIRDTGMAVTDGIHSTGLIYADDYSPAGSLLDYWIPHWKAVKDYVTNNSGGSPAGLDGFVQFNNGGSFGGSSGFTYSDNYLHVVNLDVSGGYLHVRNRLTSAQFEWQDLNSDQNIIITEFQDTINDAQNRFDNNRELPTVQAVLDYGSANWAGSLFDGDSITLEEDATTFTHYRPQEIITFINNGARMKFQPGQPDGASASPYYFDTGNLLSTEGANIIEVYNQGNHRLELDHGGKLSVVGLEVGSIIPDVNYFSASDTGVVINTDSAYFYGQSKNVWTYIRINPVTKALELDTLIINASAALDIPLPELDTLLRNRVDGEILWPVIGGNGKVRWTRGLDPSDLTEVNSGNMAMNELNLRYNLKNEKEIEELKEKSWFNGLHLAVILLLISQVISFVFLNKKMHKWND